jgi:outer membrane receptor for ferrienterochelin and colicin
MRSYPAFAGAFLQRIIFLFVLSLLPSMLMAQDVHGIVRGDDGSGARPLPGAHVYWLGSERGVITDDHGHFSLHGEGITDRRLVVSHVAFEPVTLEAVSGTEMEILLTQPRSAEEVEVSAQAPETYIAPMVQKTEVITAEELEHSACCDLSGCFGTTSSVQPESMDIITDTRQLSMLGLDGVYTQVLVDDVPYLMQGLNTQFGVSFIPGPFIDRISVSKGANSVLQGSESFSGLINVQLHESDANLPLFFNAFTNSFLTRQYNAYAMRSFGKWSAMLALQGIRRGVRVDRNDDSFLDAPLTDRYSVLAKWKYDDEEGGVISRSGVKYTWEDRLGGQTDFETDSHLGGTTFYGQLVENRRLEIYDRTEFAVGEDQALTVHLAGSRHTQNAWYGPTRFDAEEYMGYADLTYAIPWMEEHTLKSGVSWRYTDLQADVDLGANPHGKSYAGAHDFRENVPGVFAENKSNFFADALTIITGVRADFRRDEGTIVTPRAFLRYTIDETTTLRASAGTAYRAARPFVEHPAALGSWRDIRVQEELRGERAVNYGVNLTHLYSAGPLSGTLSLDLYRTEFSEQVVAEYDDDPQTIAFRNLTGSSASDNLLLEATADLAPLSFRVSYTYSDVYEETTSGTRSLPFVSRHRALSVIHASTADDTWQATFTTEWRGPQSLPETMSYPAEFQLAAESDPFALLHLHLQRSWETFDLYVGMENLLDFRQDNPILNAQRPFARYFEPGFSWGPVKGREAYAGIRARLQIF